MPKTAVLALAAILLAPSSLLLAVAVLMSPAAQAQCLTGTTTVVAVDAAVPESARVVIPLPAGTWVRTSGFGMRVHPVTGVHRLHSGLDLAAPSGTPILAAADGRVEFAGATPGYGHLILIEHTVAGQRVATGYAHMPANGIHVTVGDWVTAAQHIGDVGSDGNSTGPHLHFEVRPAGPDGPAVDPEPWLASNGASTVTPAQAGSGPGCRTGGPATAYSGENPDRLVPDPTTSGHITERTAHMLAQVQRHFPDSQWSCWSPRPGQKSEHPLGRACDATFGNAIGTAATGPALDLGWQVTNWLKDNAEVLGVDYLIWQGRIWSLARDAEGWRPYNGGGMHSVHDVTGGHYDHLHVTVAS